MCRKAWGELLVCLLGSGPPWRWLIRTPAQKMLRKGGDSAPAGPAGDRLPLWSISRGTHCQPHDRCPTWAEAVPFLFPYCPRRAEPTEGREFCGGGTPGVSPPPLPATVSRIPLATPLWAKAWSGRHGLRCPHCDLGLGTCPPHLPSLHFPFSLKWLSVPPVESRCVVRGP